MITVDPGVSYFAWAVWREGVLDTCGLWTAECAWPRGFAGPVVVECPDRRWRGTEKDLFALTRQAGFYAGRLGNGPHEFVTPQQWKDQVPKEVHHPRITAALMPREREVLPVKKGALVHVLDAVGIGLWKLGRRV